jgi:predicted CXXCH cytochrome family protein
MLIFRVFRDLSTGSFAALVIAPCLLFAAEPESTDPHWNEATCQSCHVDEVPAAGNAGLRVEDADQLCEGCHGSKGGAQPCRHASGIPAGDHPMPDSYLEALKDGQISCTTCHDLTVQCSSPHRAYRSLNPGFVRERQSRSKGDQCFVCHDTAGYERLNPHVMKSGDPAQPMCTFCHATMPERLENGWAEVDFNITDSLNDMCQGCHKTRPHPGSMFSSGPPGGNHLAVPSAAIRENMRETEETLALIFPLDPATGEVYCATCHNPHPEDLEGYPVSSLPGSRYMLRVDNNCQACHDL